MRARLIVPVPFTISTPTEEQFHGWEYRIGDLVVQSRPPTRTDRPLVNAPHAMTIDGRPAVHSDAVVLDFVKDSFDRRAGAPVDPPLDVLDAALNGFLSHVRVITRASQVRGISLNETPYQLQYLNDDGSELEPDPAAKLVRVRAMKKFSLSVLAVTSNTWDAIHSLDSEYRAPIWFNLLYDAIEMVRTEAEPAIVLATAAMEVFAARVLDDLAAQSAVPPALWSWINSRDRYERNPDLDEQFDDLLKVLCGHSLKEHVGVWDKLMNLRTARNKFVHEGRARVGGSPVDRQTAAQLVLNALEVTRLIRGWLPEALRWPEVELKTVVESTVQVFGAPAPADTVAPVDASQPGGASPPGARPEPT